MTSAALFAAARAAQAERDGARIKLRIPADLLRDIRTCADACGIPLADWTAAACRRVPTRETSAKVTRRDSTTVWLRAPAALTPAQIRSRLRAAADLAIPLIPPPPADTILPLDARPGIDYLLETNP